MPSKSLLLCLAVALTSVKAQKYGNNHVPVRRDNATVEAAFPEPNVTLIAPAFTNTESIPERFANGSSGPTPDWEMGKALSLITSASLEPSRHQNFYGC
jgi:hypothetical protein